jgi:hypothetical protein
MRTDADTGELYADEAQIESLVRGFEACALAEFKHASHLVVALWYLARLPESEAFARMRAGLRRFAAHHGSNLYHETITLFWLKLVRDFLAREGAGRPLHEIANRLVASCSDARLVFEYFSEPLIWSDAAKTSWVEPDLKPLDFKDKDEG